MNLTASADVCDLLSKQPPIRRVVYDIRQSLLNVGLVQQKVSQPLRIGLEALDLTHSR
jgi:hypothetical protein